MLVSVLCLAGVDLESLQEWGGRLVRVYSKVFIFILLMIFFFFARIIRIKLMRRKSLKGEM